MQGDMPVFANDVVDARAGFTGRHIGPSEEDQRAMLATLGYASLDDLLTAALPAYASPPASLGELPAPRTETDALADLRRLRDCGVGAALVASALHDGALTREDVDGLRAPFDRG